MAPPSEFHPAPPVPIKPGISVNTVETDDGFIRNRFPEPYFTPNKEPTEREQKHINTIYRVMQEFWLLNSREAGRMVYDQGALRHDPLVPNIVGPEDYSDFVAEYHAAWKFTKFHLQMALCEQDWMAWRVSTRCIHIGPFYGVPASGCDLEVITQTFVTFNKDGQAREGFILTDYLTVVKTMLTALPWWKIVLFGPRMYLTLKKKWRLMIESGHRPIVREGHGDLQKGKDGYLRDNFPTPYLEGEEPTPEEIKHVGVCLRAIKEYWFEGKTEIGPEIFAENHLRHDPMVPDMGLEAYAEVIKYFHKAFDFKIMDIQIALAEGDFVALRAVTKAVHVGEFYGFPASGAEVIVTTHVYTRFNAEDKIMEAWAITDYMSLFMDLFFALPFWKQMASIPAIYKAVKKHLEVLHSPKNRSFAGAASTGLKTPPRDQPPAAAP